MVPSQEANGDILGNFVFRFSTQYLYVKRTNYASMKRF